MSDGVLRGFFHETAVHYLPMSLEKLDGKYEIKREISRDVALRSVEAATIDVVPCDLIGFLSPIPKAVLTFTVTVQP